ETLSAQARNDRVENEIREAIASLLLPSLVMIALTLLLSFWAINWIIRPLRSLQDSLAHRSADNLTPLPVYSEMDEIVAVTTSINQLFSRLDHTLQQERLFTADAAHELRTPLAGLRLHLELLHQQNVPQSEMLIERIDQLMHTVEQLLMLSRAGQALAGGHYQQLLWQKDIMQPLQPEMAELYAQRQQTLHWPHGKDIPQQGEAVLLRLMLRNLLENASRYSPEGSEVKVKMQQDKQQVIIEVWDQGPGIEADAAEELTQAFRRRDQRYGGSGLGLNIVLRIVQMHRGRLELVNRKDSSGLIARCYLPHQLL
ncbi:two-component system sensor histidine kinase PmrB, partial [Serratia sp. Se-PFBMAAmG]|nr:two-component system sensor histidine kinase PmrB [Serratia sp. Se-PFBMAAmG]